MSVITISQQPTRVGATIYAMFPVSWFVVAITLAAYTTAGLAIGAATGWLISRLRMGSQKNILNDALLGSLGFVAGFFGCIFITPNILSWFREEVSNTIRW
jgi:NhaP-type Na+/H+ or K+/H+ antiporter